MRTIYSAPWVYPVSGPALRDAHVEVEDGVIVRVGPVSAIRPLDAHRVHLDHAVIMPGLVNAHSHLELTVMRGLLEGRPFHQWIRDLTRIKYRLLTPDDLATSALAGCLEATRAGVTTLADTCDSGAAVTAMTRSGLRGVVYQEVFGPRSAEAETALKDVVRKIVALRKIAGPLIKIGVSPHALYTVSRQLFAMVGRYAAREELDVAIHAAESAAEEELTIAGTGPWADSLRARGIPVTATGKSPIDTLAESGALETAPLIIHAVRVSQADIESLASRACRIAHCPKSNAKLGHGIAPLAQFLAKDMRVGIGTDSPASNNVMDMLDETRAATLMGRARDRDAGFLPAATAIELATRGGARALKMDATIGTLEAGKRADLIAVRTDEIHAGPLYDPGAALVFGTRASDVILTVVDGEPLWADGVFTRLDATDIRARLDAIGRRIESGIEGGALGDAWSGQESTGSRGRALAARQHPLAGCGAKPHIDS